MRENGASTEMIIRQCAKPEHKLDWLRELNEIRNLPEPEARRISW